MQHDFIFVILNLFLKYYDVNRIYLFEKIYQTSAGRLVFLKNKNLNLTNIKCSNQISELN